ncbi:MAG: methyl-accepting chemotaxis protein [Desulfobacterales bacterium]|nr:methyl-accepting chemotaxis protein [Desulfobacterales bacterium]
MEMLKTLRGKLMAGFLVIASITAIVSLISYSGMKNLEQKFKTVIESAPLIESAINMKLILSRDIMMVMKLMAALDTDELDAIWKDHDANIKKFNLFKQAILSGGTLNGKTIVPAKDKALLEVVKQSGTAYEKEFLPKFKIAYEQMHSQLSAEPYDYDLLDTIDETTIEKGNGLTARLDKAIESIQALIVAAESEVRKEKSRAETLIWSATLAGIAVAVLLGLFISGKIAGPIKQADDFIQAVAKGDFTHSLKIVRNDEIGSMVGAINEMVEKLAQVFREITTGVATLNQTSSGLSKVSGDLEAGAGEMSDRSGAVADAARGMSERLNSVAASSEQSSSNLDMVSAAMEEMNTTVNEIAKNTGDAKAITESAVTTARHASLKVNELGDDAREIGEVTEVISEISGQTNLLALNATIEAARAGEAGKGFAVVANEIKDLADQTARAAQDISRKISKIQQSSRGTVDEIGQISTVINEVDGIVSSISTAIEEQSITAREISNNIAQAAQGIHETNANIGESSQASSGIAGDIASVNTNAMAVNDSTREVNDSVGKLRDFARSLKDILGRFKV